MVRVLDVICLVSYFNFPKFLHLFIFGCSASLFLHGLSSSHVDYFSMQYPGFSLWYFSCCGVPVSDLWVWAHEVPMQEVVCNPVKEEDHVSTGEFFFRDNFSLVTCSHYTTFHCSYLWMPSISYYSTAPSNKSQEAVEDEEMWDFLVVRWPCTSNACGWKNK